MDESEFLPSDDVNFLNLSKILEVKGRVNEELKQLHIANLTANQDLGNQEEESELSLSNRVNSLKLQLLKESNKCSNMNLLQKQIQIGKTLTDELFSEETPFQENEYSAQSLKQLQLATDVGRISSETAELKEKLDKKKEANLKLKLENVNLMTKLKEERDLQSKVSNELKNIPHYKKLKDQLEKQCEGIEINKSVAQLIIMTTCNNLHEDEQMMELLLKCGEPVNL